MAGASVNLGRRGWCGRTLDIDRSGNHTRRDQNIGAAGKAVGRQLDQAEGKIQAGVRTQEIGQGFHLAADAVTVQSHGEINREPRVVVCGSCRRP